MAGVSSNMPCAECRSCSALSRFRASSTQASGGLAIEAASLFSHPARVQPRWGATRHSIGYGLPPVTVARIRERKIARDHLPAKPVLTPAGKAGILRRRAVRATIPRSAASHDWRRSLFPSGCAFPHRAGKVSLGAKPEAPAFNHGPPLSAESGCYWVAPHRSFDRVRTTGTRRCTSATLSPPLSLQLDIPIEIVPEALANIAR